MGETRGWGLESVRGKETERDREGGREEEGGEKKKRGIIIKTKGEERRKSMGLM